MDKVKLFESKKVRTYWDEKGEKWYFSVVDVIEILTDSPRPRKYWNALKVKLKTEGSEVSHNLGQLKMKAEDGKMRQTDVADTEIFAPHNSIYPFPESRAIQTMVGKSGV